MSPLILGWPFPENKRLEHMTFSYPIRSWERLGPHPIILYGVTFQKRRTKEINHSVERNKKKLPEGTNIFWALQTWAPRPPSWLKWAATACVFFVLFLPQGTSSFIFRGCVTMGRTFQGRVTSSGILKLSPLTLLPLAGFWSIIHQVQGNEPDIETPSSFCLFFDW